MSNRDHLRRLSQGVDAWNAWRARHPGLHPDLSAAVLESAAFTGVDFHNTTFERARLGRAKFTECDLSSAKFVSADLHHAVLVNSTAGKADFSGARLHFLRTESVSFDGADLTAADLYGATFKNTKLRRSYCRDVNVIDAHLRGSDFTSACLLQSNFRGTDLRDAILRGADLTGAVMVDVNMNSVDMTGCNVYGLSVWNVELEGTIQKDLVISVPPEPEISVDNIEMAQFVYLLIRNEKIRGAIETITSKLVLILGRFSAARKEVLDKLRETLRLRDYVPVLFDFERPSSRDYTETVKTLALMSRFVIADITAPRSVPQELQAIIPVNKIPIVPIIHSSEEPYAMFRDFQIYPWVLELVSYDTTVDLIDHMQELIIEPAEAKVTELQSLKNH